MVTTLNKGASTSLPEPSGTRPAALTPGWYEDGDGETIEIRSLATGPHIDEHGVPLRIRANADDRFVIDGRISGDASTPGAVNLRR